MLKLVFKFNILLLTKYIFLRLSNQIYIVASNHIAQVKPQPRISWTESRECAPYFCASRIACANNMSRLCHKNGTRPPSCTKP